MKLFSKVTDIVDSIKVIDLYFTFASHDDDDDDERCDGDDDADDDDASDGGC